MARMPGVDWLPANDGNSHLSMARYDIVCVHTIVGYAPAPAAHFSTDRYGKIWQHRDTSVQSAANYYGNYRVIAIENEDHGAEFGSWSSPNVPGFTEAQKESIARILVWANQVHGIPLVPCPDSRPGSRGIAYHRQGIDGNWAGFAYGGRVPGGEVWSTSQGKICPGDRRITQLLNEIIPRAQALARGEDNELTPDEHNALARLFDGFFGGPNYTPGGDAFNAIVKATRDAVLDTPVNRVGPYQDADPKAPKTITLRDVLGYFANNTDGVRPAVDEIKKAVVK